LPEIHLPSGIVNYEDRGSGHPVVLLHANPGDCRDFDAVAHDLAEHYRVIALDWPGYGRSAIPPVPEEVNLAFFHSVLLEFLSALDPGPAVLIGNSVGGWAAVRVACTRPAAVRGLVLVSPGGFTTMTPFTQAFCALQSGRLSIPPSWFARLYLRKRTPAVEQMLMRASTEQSDRSRREINRAVWRSFAKGEGDLQVSASEVKAPTLVVVGRYDPVIPASRDGMRAARAIVGSRLVCLPCGHAAFAELPERFVTETLGFIASLPPA